MQNSRLFQYLKTFTKSEMTQFGKFLNSPYFNNSKAAIGLFNLVKRHHPNFEAKGLAKEKLYQKLFPKERFNNKKILDLASDLNKYIEKFWRIQDLESDKKAVRRYTVNAFGKRYLMNDFTNEVHRWEADLDKGSIRDMEYHFALQEIGESMYFNASADKRFDGKLYLLQTMSHFDKYFILRKMRLSLEFLQRDNLYADEQEILLLQEVLELAKKFESQEPIFRIYRKTLNLWLSEEETPITAFGQLIRMFHLHQDLFSFGELSYLTNTLSNYAIHRHNSGDSSAMEILFKIYKVAIEKELFLIDNKMPNANFSAIAATSVACKDFDWCEQFIERYSMMLSNIDEGTFLVAYSKANLAFHRGNFDEANQLISIEDKTPEFLKPFLRLLQIRCHFEYFLKDDTVYDLLNNSIINFQQFLKRTDFYAQDRVDMYLSTLKVIKKMVHLLKKEASSSEIEKLQKEIEDNPKLFIRDWLKEKLLQIKNLGLN